VHGHAAIDGRGQSGSAACLAEEKKRESRIAALNFSANGLGHAQTSAEGETHGR
jgi:hypothetical protein